MFVNGVAQLEDNRYSGTIKIDDINYQITSDENRGDIFASWMELLNANSPEEGLNITIHNHSLDEEQYKDDILLKCHKDGLNHYREEMNGVLIDNMRTGSNNIISDKYISFAVQEDTLDEAYRELTTIQKELNRKLKTLGCRQENTMLSGLDRLTLLSNIFLPKKKLHFDYAYLDGNTTKDAIAPDNIDFQPKSHFKIEDRFCKCLFLKSYSTELCDAFISDLTKLQYNFVINIHLKIMDQTEALTLVQRQKSSMEMDKISEQRKAEKNGYDRDMIPEEINYSLQEANDLLSDIKTRNQRLFNCQFVMMLNCKDLDELNELEKRANNIAKKHNLDLGSINIFQEAGFQAALPLCYSKLPIARTLTTSAAASFIPFTSMELIHRTIGSVYYGMNAISGNLILCDRTKLLNPSGWILGKPGGGKSFAAKREMIYKLLSDPLADVITIDPEREYGHIAQLPGIDGTIVYVNNTSGNRLNPLDGNIEDKDFLSNKVEFCQAMTASMVGDRQMTAIARSLIDRCARQMYGTYSEQVLSAKKKGNPIPDCPTFATFYQVMKDQEEPEAKQLAKAMEIYVEGTNNFFAGKSNVDVKNRYTVYDIRDIPQTMKPLSMLVILESLWQRIIENKRIGKTTWVYIDEIYLLLMSSFCLDFFKTLWKRARKYNAIITGISQNIEELLENTATSTMISNSEFILMLNQARKDRDRLSHLLNISEEQMTYISNSEEGSGLLSNGKAIIPFNDNFPKNTDLYRAMTTKPKERIEIDAQNTA